jgi:hypothetical protein
LGQLEEARRRDNEALERHNELQGRAASIVEQQRTPLDELKRRLEEIRDLHATGFLSLDEAARANQAARQGFESNVLAEQTQSPRRGANAAIKFGSVEAFRAVRDSRQDELSKKQLKAIEEGNEVARQQLEEMKRQDRLPPAPW